ncbi:unnamed protein product, partial [Prorocentrum cordatum]
MRNKPNVTTIRTRSLEYRGGSEANSVTSRSSPWRPERWPAKGGRQAPAPHEGDPVLFKASGEPIWNPQAFVAKITSYDGGLFTPDWKEVRNPKAYVAGISRSSTWAGGGSEAESILYKADGTPIR